MITIFIAPDGRLRPIWRFLFAVLFVIAAPTFLAQWVIGAPIENDLLRDIVVTCSTTLFALAGSLFLLSILAQKQGGVRALMRELGFVRRKVLIDIALGFAVSFILITVAVAAIALLGRIRPHRQPITLLTCGLAAVNSGWLILAALAEELQFRLYPFQELRESIGAIPAAVVLSIGFGAMHLNNPSFGKLALLNTALIGGVLALAYIRTRTVWMIWALHFGWNFVLGVIYGLPVSGFSFAVVVKSTTLGHRWLTGGSYGIEGSLTGAVVILLGYPMVWLATARRAREVARIETLTETKPEVPLIN